MRIENKICCTLEITNTLNLYEVNRLRSFSVKLKTLYSKNIQNTGNNRLNETQMNGINCSLKKYRMKMYHISKALYLFYIVS